MGLDATLGFAMITVFTYGIVSLGIRRLHDVGRSGTWLLLWLIPGVNLLLAALLHVVPGTKGDNHLGS